MRNTIYIMCFIGVLNLNNTNAQTDGFFQYSTCLKEVSFSKTIKMKTCTLDEVTDEFIGKQGTTERDAFDAELRSDHIGYAIKQARLERNLTQTQLGELVGVQKAQISKIENSISSARLETILKVFRALNAKVNFQVELLNEKMTLAS